ncbi:M50 family metallopeptidase [Nocardioides zeae]|uniref:M50 family metallopeptidase n=1 Tax=Nocardioides imazamoxiresistens TaxID=3231893 RepID=A0ABU3PWV2_9ACTN|nr:M50 family metallopeptidase [Nocardioides zeae]MDT9593725.1 M50 family metallopeptidase [Nocardioides zeae]
MQDFLDRVLGDSVTPQPPLDERAALAAVALAAVLVLWRPAWRRTRHLVTIAHEGGHGVAALLAGRRLSGIRLHRDTSGLTVSRGRPTGPGMVVTALAGYVAPSVLGLVAAFMVSRGYAVGALWVALALLALLLLQIRNFFGLWAVLVAGSGVFAVSWWAPAPLQVAVATAATAFLLLAAPRPVLELQAQRRAGRAPHSDADMLARLTPLPGGFWVAVFLVVTGAAALGGGALLWQAAS